MVIGPGGCQMSPQGQQAGGTEGEAGRSILARQGWGQTRRGVKNNSPPWPLVEPESVSEVQKCSYCKFTCSGACGGGGVPWDEDELEVREQGVHGKGLGITA